MGIRYLDPKIIERNVFVSPLYVASNNHFACFLASRAGPFGLTWTPRVCKIIAFWAPCIGFGPSFYILLGSMYCMQLRVFH